jgi:hypothetical protein
MKFTRRLERLEVVSAPAGDPPMLEARIIELATGEIVEQILTPWDEPEDYRRQRHHWPHIAE